MAPQRPVSSTDELVLPEGSRLDPAFVRPAAVADTYALVDIVRSGRRIAHVRVEAWQTDTSATVTMGQGTFAVW